MRDRTAIGLAGGLLAVTAACSEPATVWSYPAYKSTIEDSEAFGSQIDGGADPKADALGAIAKGDFGLLVFQSGWGSGKHPIGVTCFTPYVQAPRERAIVAGGDVIDAQVSKRLNYSKAYNRVVVDHPDYPDADLCRAAAPDDRAEPWDRMMPSLAARTVARAPNSLHEAARRGGLADLKRFDPGEIDSIDGVGMTPLAWAVARNNAIAVDYLLKAGAGPGKGQVREDAVYWSAALGRADYFQRFMEIRPRIFVLWPSWHLAAAAKGDPDILEVMLAEPHEAFRIELLGSEMPDARAVEMLLVDNPSLADPLLRHVIGSSGLRGRTDLMALALRHGANPNAEANSSRTVLGEISDGLDPASLESVDLLLNKGADPNALSWIERPVWIAIGSAKLFHNNAKLHARAIAIYRRLRQAGADINLLDGEGVPPIRKLLFPGRPDYDELDANTGTPQLLEMLAADGLDLNVRWHGKRVLELVDKQAGANSELALTLRRLGARR